MQICEVTSLVLTMTGQWGWLSLTIVRINEDIIIITSIYKAPFIGAYKHCKSIYGIIIYMMMMIMMTDDNDDKADCDDNDDGDDSHDNDDWWYWWQWWLMTVMTMMYITMMTMITMMSMMPVTTVVALMTAMTMTNCNIPHLISVHSAGWSDNS